MALFRQIDFGCMVGKPCVVAQPSGYTGVEAVNLALLLLQIAVILTACWIVRHAIVGSRSAAGHGRNCRRSVAWPILLRVDRSGRIHDLFPAPSLPALNGLSQIGLVLFMFLVGLRLDLSEVYAVRRVAGLAAIFSVVLPFTMGFAIAGHLFWLAPAGSGMLGFALFIAVSMSITAFPVLARILADRGLADTRSGMSPFGCAALNDVAAWCMLAALTAMVRAGQGHASFYGPILTVIGYVVVMSGPIRIGLRNWVARFGDIVELPLILIFVFLSSWFTESIGIHALFGAFLAGVVWPRA